MKKSKFNDAQIVAILQEAIRGEKSQSQICREHGISENTFYVWKRKYGGLESQNVRRLKALERENAHLKRLLAERDLEVDAVKPLFQKNGWMLPNASRGSRR